MARFIGRRVLDAAITLILIAIIVFAVVRILPGDPAATITGGRPGLTQAQLAQYDRSLGLDQSIIIQFWKWVSHAITGNFGESYFSSTGVGGLVASALGPTLELTVLTTLATVVFTCGMACLVGLRPNGWIDRIVTSLVTPALTLPVFCFAILLVWLVAIKGHLLPPRGYVSPSDDLLQNLRLAILPTAALTIVVTAPVYRLVRAALLETLAMDFVRTAEGKGLSRRRVVFRHAIPSAVLPGLAALGTNVGALLGGIVVIEYIFGWPGLGSLALSALTRDDYPVVQAVVVLAGFAFLVVTLSVDVLSAVWDPRLRKR